MLLLFKQNLAEKTERLERCDVRSSTTFKTEQKDILARLVTLKYNQYRQTFLKPASFALVLVMLLN